MADYTRRPGLNVKDGPWFARGDGVTDDTAVIQAAIDAVSIRGGLVDLPTGTYLISSTLLHRSNVTIRGQGAQTILRRAPALAGTLITNASWATNNGNYVPAEWVVDHDMGLIDLALDGNKAAEAFVYDRNGAWYSRCERVKCRGLYIYDCQNDGLIYEFCRYSTIDHCWAYENSKAGLYLSGCDWCSATQNLCYANWGGIVCSTSFYCLVTHNICVQNELHGQVATALGIHGGRGGESCIFAGNVAEGIELTAEDPGQPNVFDAEHPVAETWAAAPMGQYRSILAHNVLVGHAGYGLAAAYSDANIIEGNQILGNGASVVLGGAKNNIMRGNLLTENALAGPYAGILLSREGAQPENTGNEIAGNCLRQGTQGQMAGVTIEDDGAQNNVIRDNRLAVDTALQLPVAANYAANSIHENVVDTAPAAVHVLADSATPSVQSARVCQTAFAAPTTVTNLTDGVAGQEVIIVVNGSATTINSGGNFRLAGAAAFVGADGSSLSLVRVASVWTETARTS